MGKEHEIMFHEDLSMEPSFRVNEQHGGKKLENRQVVSLPSSNCDRMPIIDAARDSSAVFGQSLFQLSVPLYSIIDSKGVAEPVSCETFPQLPPRVTSYIIIK